ncbi:MAG: DNA-formamidopyrimidine glycosylase [Parachlamydiaceae bacterium]|nr:DNA-formamidopyrimidine glycosylase [Parachlamydiaceae bacterium]
MPELPEVETIVQGLRKEGLIGLKVKRALVYWERSLADHSSSSFSHRIVEQTIVDITRKGKFLVFSLDQDTLLVHLRMTGKFFVEDQGAAIHPHERIRLCLSDHRILRYEDQRKFGKWYLLSDPEEVLHKIGIEPLSRDFTLIAFKRLLENSNRQIKPFLLDQHYIAGLGNIYVDEALWEAKIHPLRSIQSLNEKEKALLHRAIILVLKKGVANSGTSLGAYRSNYLSVAGRRGSNQQDLKVFRREGLSCSRCNGIIKKIVVAQRGTHICPICQDAPITILT